MEQDLPRGGEPDVSAVALQQFGAKIGLHLLHGAAESRLRDAQPLGGAGIAQFLGHGLKIAEMSEIHR